MTSGELENYNRNGENRIKRKVIHMRRRKQFMGILLSWILLMGIFQLAPVHLEGAQVFAETIQSGDNSLSSLSISPGTLSPAFQYNVVDYTASVGADVTSVEVSATPSNDTATIESVSGNTDLQAGENLVSVVVKAQNGVTATYKIVVTREGTQEDTAQDTQDAPAQEPQTEGTEGGITLDGHPFNLAPAIPDEVVPQDFTKTTVTCQGQQVEGLTFDKAELTLVYLTTPSTEVKNTLAVYENEGSVYPFRKVLLDEANYIIILNPPQETGLSQEFTQTEQTVGDFAHVPAFVRAGGALQTEEPQADEGAEAGEDSNSEGFFLIYGASSYGTKGWYQYDTKESTLQRYNPVELAVQQSAPSIQPEDELEPSAEMQSLQKAYTDMEEQYNSQKDTSRKTTAVLIFIIAVLLVVVVNLLLRGRRGEDEDTEDMEYDDLAKKFRSQMKNEKKSHHREEKSLPELGSDIRQKKNLGVKDVAKVEKNAERKQIKSEQKADRKQSGTEHLTGRKQPGAEHLTGRKQPDTEVMAGRKQPGTEPMTSRKQPGAEPMTSRRQPEVRVTLDDDFEVIDLEDL